MRMAAIQMLSGPDVASNLAQAARLLAQAADAGARLAALPEYFCLMGHTDRDKLAVSEAPGSGPIQDFLRTQAQRCGLWLVGGSMPLRTPDAAYAYNSTLVFDPQGEQVARYDKIHLFAFAREEERYDESATQRPGTQCVAFDLPDGDGAVWRVGLSICYDLRFPELYRALGADVLLVPSAFTHTTGRAHWELLLRARAVENLAYVAAPAQGGLHANGRRTWGQTLICDPWGEVLAQQAQGAGVVLADAQQAVLRERRAQLPALQHRKLGRPA